MPTLSVYVPAFTSSEVVAPFATSVGWPVRTGFVVSATAPAVAVTVAPALYVFRDTSTPRTLIDRATGEVEGSLCVNERSASCVNEN